MVSVSTLNEDRSNISTYNKFLKKNKFLALYKF